MKERKDLLVELVSLKAKRKFNDLADNSESGGKFEHDNAEFDDGILTNEVRMEGTTKEGETIFFTVDSWTYGHKAAMPRDLLRTGKYEVEQCITYKKGEKVPMPDGGKDWEPKVTTHLGGFAVHVG